MAKYLDKPMTMKYPTMRLTDLLDDYREWAIAQCQDKLEEDNIFSAEVRADVTIYEEEVGDQDIYQVMGVFKLCQGDGTVLEYAPPRRFVLSHEDFMNILDEIKLWLRDPEHRYGVKTRPTELFLICAEPINYNINLRVNMDPDDAMVLFTNPSAIHDHCVFRSPVGQSFTLIFEYWGHDVTNFLNQKESVLNENGTINETALAASLDLPTGMLKMPTEADVPQPGNMDGTPVSMSGQDTSSSIMDDMYSQISQHAQSEGEIPVSAGVDDLSKEALELAELKNKQDMDRNIREMRAAMERMSKESEVKEATQEEQDAADSFFNPVVDDDEPLKDGDDLSRPQ